MKTKILAVIFVTVLLIAGLNQAAFSQGVGISSSSITPDPSSMLEVRSTDKGMLIPRMATAPSSPANGLIYYNTTDKEFKYRDGTSSTWIAIPTGTSKLPVANGGTNSSTALSGSSIMVSNGTAIVQGPAGTTTTVLHGNAGGAPTYGAVALGSSGDVTGTLTVGNGGTGQSSALVAGGVLYGSSTTAAAVTSAGTSGQVLLSAGSGSPTWGAAPGTLIGIQKITSGTTYTPTTGTKAIILEMVGGGGGGGGASCSAAAKSGSAGGGGGAAGYLRKYITFTTLAANYTIAIGAAGTGVSSAAGNPGGNTTFATDANAVPASTTFTAYGGGGGTYINSNATKEACIGGNGGAVSSNGDVNASGAPGGFGIARAQEYIVSGSGGSGIFGGGGNSKLDAGSVNLAQNGNAATGYGAGGGGATTQSSGAAQVATGGNGTAGIIVIYEFR